MIHGKKHIALMGGIGYVFTFGAFAIASLSMIGAPPVAGFVTKWNLLIGSIQAHQIGILLILIASTLLNAAYFAPVTYKAFFGKRPENEPYQGIKEAPLSMLIPILIACAISVFIGINPNFHQNYPINYEIIKTNFLILLLISYDPKYEKCFQSPHILS